MFVPSALLETALPHKWAIMMPDVSKELVCVPQVYCRLFAWEAKLRLSTVSVFWILFIAHGSFSAFAWMKPTESHVNVFSRFVSVLSCLDIHFAGENLPYQRAQSYTCPLCGVMGFTLHRMREHVTSEHGRSHREVVGIVFPIQYAFMKMCCAHQGTCTCLICTSSTVSKLVAIESP